jgi:hypothetical protein
MMHRVKLASASHRIGLGLICLALLAPLKVTMVSASASTPAEIHGLLRQVYSGIPGASLSSLTNSPAFPNLQTSENIISDFFEAPSNVAENYGQRLMALITPPTTGDYTFWIASDDQSALYLGTNENPATKSLIAQVPGWTEAQSWNRYPEQKSAAISLQSGKKYYIEALMKEGNGGDNLAVRWQLPDS